MYIIYVLKLHLKLFRWLLFQISHKKYPSGIILNGLVLEAMNWKISMGTSPSRSSFVEHCAVVAWTALHLRQGHKTSYVPVCSSHVDNM